MVAEKKTKFNCHIFSEIFLSYVNNVMLIIMLTSFCMLASNVVYYGMGTYDVD